MILAKLTRPLYLSMMAIAPKLGRWSNDQNLWMVLGGVT